MMSVEQTMERIRQRILDPNNTSPPIKKLLAYRLLWVFMGKPAKIIPINIPELPRNNTLSETLPG